MIKPASNSKLPHFARCATILMVKRTDVQNIDMMNLAGFCRNCLSRWYQEAANERGIDMDKTQAREIFYGMSMDDWKANYQSDANDDQKRPLTRPFPKTWDPKINRICVDLR